MTILIVLAVIAVFATLLWHFVLREVLGTLQLLFGAMWLLYFGGRAVVTFARPSIRFWR